MKKVFKSFAALALGLSLILTGCSKDDPDYTGDVIGTYTADVNVSLQGSPLPAINTTLNLVKDGANLKATATVTLPAYIPNYGGQTININLVFSSLLANQQSAEGVTAVGYFYKIAEQPINVFGNNMNFKGVTSEDYNGYDGEVFSLSGQGMSLKNLSFSIKDTMGQNIAIDVEAFIGMPL